MNENLLTLKQIADQIGVNYKTLLSCKQRLEEFVLGVPVGRVARYSENTADLFRLVFALFDEGYSTGKVRDLLLNGVEAEEDAFIESWLEECRAHIGLNNTGPGTGKEAVQGKEEADGLTDGMTGPPTDRLTDDAIRELVSDTQTRIEYLHNQNLEITSQSLHTFAQDVEQALQKMATQTNIAITALCEASEDIRKGVQSLDDRLTQLENDLDMEQAEDLDLYHVDAGDYQVDLPEVSTPTLPGQDTEPEDDLAPVRNSIEDGKPDRDVLVDWITSKRSRESSRTSSYNVLANQLNEAGIPTLSGRDNWSRSTVRNLVVRSQTEEVEETEKAEQE